MFFLLRFEAFNTTALISPEEIEESKNKNGCSKAKAITNQNPIVSLFSHLKRVQPRFKEAYRELEWAKNVSHSQNTNVQDDQ